MRQRRRVLPGRARVAFALGCAGALIGVAAVPAQAAEVSFATHCIPPVGDPVDGTTKVEITAPQTAKVGDEVEVVWKFVQAASKNPGPIVIEKDKVKPTGTLKAAGAQTADIAMEGPQENPEIPIGSDMVLSDMKGTLKLTTAGDVTLTPDAFVVNAYGTKTNCAPTEAVPTAATIKVEAGDGSSSPTPSPTPTESESTSPTPTESATESPSSSPSETDGGQTDFTGEVVDIPYTCESPIGTQKATSTIQINAKKDGGDFDITVQFKKSPMNSPAPIPAGKLQPFMNVVLGGADEGSVAVEGPVNAEEIKTGDPIEIPDMTGTYKPGATGESTLSPGVLTIKALGTTTTCTPDKTSVSLTLDTTEQEGGAAGGSSSTGGGSSSSGGLAATGSEDHDALKALGLVAGTAVLLGAAVFTFLPGRRRLR